MNHATAGKRTGEVLCATSRSLARELDHIVGQRASLSA